MLSFSPARTPNYNLLLNWLTGECCTPPKQHTPGPRAKEKQQQDGKRGKIAFRIKPHIHQRCSEGSNKPCVHQDPETPQSLNQNCPSVSYRGTDQQWPAAEAGALGAVDLGMAYTLLEEVTINPTIEPPELT